MILCVLGLLPLIPSPGDRDPAADGAIRRAAQRMAQLTSWSASITVDRTNTARDGPTIDLTVRHASPPTLRRTGILRARSPYGFLVTLHGLSDRELPFPEKKPRYSSDPVFADRWSKIASENKELRVTYIGGREVHYRFSPDNLMTFTGNIAPLMLWLDSAKLLSFLGEEFCVTGAGRQVLDGHTCTIVQVRRPETKSSYPKDVLRLFVDEIGILRRTDYSVDGVKSYFVSVSNIRVGEHEGASLPRARLVEDSETDEPVWSLVEFELLQWETPITK